MLFFICLFVTVGFGIARFVVPVEGKVNKKDIFKDMAHLFVGFLFGVATYSEEGQYWGLAIGLTALEVVAFFVRRK